MPFVLFMNSIFYFFCTLHGASALCGVMTGRLVVSQKSLAYVCVELK